MWRHRKALIFKFSKFGNHSRILHAKINLNAMFHLFIQIRRGIIDTLPILGYFGPKLVLWRHRKALIFNFSKVGLHNRISPAKISLNAKFHHFIQIPRRIIDALPILGYFGPKLVLWRHKNAQILKNSKFRLRNRILPAKIILNTKFHVFIPFSGEIMLRYFYRGLIYGMNCSGHVTLLQPP